MYNKHIILYIKNTETYNEIIIESNTIYNKKSQKMIPTHKLLKIYNNYIQEICKIPLPPITIDEDIIKYE